MQQSFYGERDYAFGQAMLGLRTTLGLTQAGLAELLGVSRKAVSRWEAGDTYPKAEHLKAVLTLAVGQQAFAAGREEEEIRAFWQAAHQKVLLDERWLQELLGPQHPRLTLLIPQHGEETSSALQIRAQSVPQPRVDWSDALAVPSFYGRAGEVATLTQWVVEERCRVVSVLGLGGIGKSALAVTLMHQVAPHFEVVIWRSLRDAPTCETLLDDCFQVLAPQALRDVSVSLERRLGLLLEHLRRTRVLLVLDNLEMLLEEGVEAGRMRPGYEGYGQLLRRVAETEQTLLLWLAIVREPVSIEQLLALLVTPLSSAQMLEAIEALHRRSLVERGQRPGSFTLQSVVLEYATARLIEEVTSEIENGRLVRLIEHGLELATVKEYVRQTQPETFVRLLAGHTNWVLGLAFAPDGSTLASASWDRTVKLWDVESRRVLQTLSGHTDRVRAVAWSPDGHLLASCGFDQTIWLWDSDRSSYRMGLQGHTAGVYDIAFTPDSRSLLSGSEDGTLRVWDVERGQCVYILQGYAVSLYDVAWSPDGIQFASAGSNTLVTIWDGEGLTPPRQLPGHRSLVFGVAWSPDGRLLASSGDDNAIQLWDLQSGEHLQTLRRDRPYERLDISGVKGVTEAQKATLRALGAIERTPAPGIQHAP